MKKVVLFAFNAEFMCFVHVLLNALDMDSRGMDVKIVIEGGATALIPELAPRGKSLGFLISQGQGPGTHSRSVLGMRHQDEHPVGRRERGLASWRRNGRTSKHGLVHGKRV